MSSVAAAARVTALAGVAQERCICDARQHVQRPRGSTVCTRREVIRIITTNEVATAVIMMTIAAVAAPATRVANIVVAAAAVVVRIRGNQSRSSTTTVTATGIARNLSETAHLQQLGRF